MPLTPIQYFNRNHGRVESESVYGENFVRWAYHRPLGRIALHLFAKRALFSRVWLAHETTR